MFGFIINNWKKSEAAVVVQKLLEIQTTTSFYEGDPAQVANDLISEVWEEKANLLSGKFGERPHKITIAAMALANKASLLTSDRETQAPFLASLATILQEIQVNGDFFPFKRVDFGIIKLVDEIFSIEANKIMENPTELDKELDMLMSGEFGDKT